MYVCMHRCTHACVYALVSDSICVCVCVRAHMCETKEAQTWSVSYYFQ